MVTIYSPSDSAAASKDATEISVTIEESNEKSPILDATFVNMRKSLRDELSEAQMSEWVTKEDSTADYRNTLQILRV